MRVLCLHGQGASPAIMESQTSTFRAYLPPTWSFDYLEAPCDSEPGPGLKGIYPPPHFCFFDKYNPEELEEAVEYVREVVEADGPYDAIMGFSQGASVAAAFIAQSPTSIKFGIFICAALIPPITALSEELVKTIGTFGHIDLPTLHCVGQHDTCYPQSVELSKSCESSLGQVLVLPGGHDVPRDDVTSRNIAHAIEKCARRALAMC
ncbi:unnamed protein product [Zymoseptoria tritici ST99CH_1A5]|uniref:Serine hydrolase domain-containing protein n=4 Tax=Zymoseptoria tritici TaxID=1047171 RepID=F9XE37_ZYMTI|nr:uncharacterized protein MYCGRDRAFT_93616 [Zymoseptoria tritici IPO323]SMQ51390.1 unnamed protein product [Zymoseptoria tritici ST99CH_3D7]SMR53410.1 unnamed protein product [Zymoseptoria tritici ST99CH_1E4]SMR55843.1 unnamed protein product [Zymoseptoria tritici ST99CH_3D1]SMY25029.1 unnamed protein product [Zymoseptoria tritici ST99CH_1A5]EGP86305.1 hypothetical protein MYCGRDRAFT_93616 [Zymoseptoria tritici IPO323]